jgi:hypothetical protein
MQISFFLEKIKIFYFSLECNKNNKKINKKVKFVTIIMIIYIYIFRHMILVSYSNKHATQTPTHTYSHTLKEIKVNKIITILFKKIKVVSNKI